MIFQNLARQPVDFGINLAGAEKLLTLRVHGRELTVAVRSAGGRGAQGGSDRTAGDGEVTLNWPAGIDLCGDFRHTLLQRRKFGRAAVPPPMHSLRSLAPLWLALCLLAAWAERGTAYTPTQMALDNVSLSFSTGSSPSGAGWMAHSTYADCLDETDGVKAASMGSPGESWVTASVSGPDTIDFMWALETTGANTLTCSIDGVVKASCSASAVARWYYAAVTVPAGQHTIRWKYQQTGEDGSRVLLDRVSHAADNWPSLTCNPSLQAVLGEPVAYTLTTKQPAVSFNLYWGSLPPGLTLDGATGQITGEPQEAGFWRPLISISSATFALYYRIGIEVLDPPALSGALESPGLQFTTTASDGTSFWQPQPRGSRDDRDCLLAGAPPPAQRTPAFLPGWSALETEVTGPDALSCWLRVANGRLSLLLDGKEYQSHRAHQSLSAWQRVWLAIPSGLHRVTWKYEPFQNRTPTAWLDEVRLRSDGRVFLEHQPEVRLHENGTISHAVPYAGLAVAWSSTGLPAGLVLDHGGGALTGTPAHRGVWNARLFVEGVSGDRDDVLMRIDASIPAPEALDLAKSSWNPGRDPGALWFGQNALTHDGADAMRSPPAPPDSMRSLTSTIQGPCTLRWWWHIPNASAADGCTCVLNGNAVLAEITGANPWRQVTVTVPGGIHDVSWRWKTDSAGDSESEAVIVDEVSLSP